MSGADRRAQLLDIARDIVAADGFTALSIDRIAHTAGVTRTVVYQQFTDLTGVMTALLDRESAIAFAGLRSVDWEQAEPDADRLGRGILAYLQAAPVSWRIFLRPPDGAPPQVRARIKLGRAYARGVAARHMSRALGTAVDPDGPTQRILLAAIEELALLHLEDPAGCPDETVVSYLRSLLWWAERAEITAG